MTMKELLEYLDLSEPADFEYFENFADIVESDKEIDEDTLATFFSEVDKDIVADVAEHYFDDMLAQIPQDQEEIYGLLEKIKYSLIVLASDEDEEDAGRFSEELLRFKAWYGAESSVMCYNVAGEEEKAMTVRDAVTQMRLSKLDDEEYNYDFSKSMDYEIDEYLLDLADIAMSEMRENSEDFLDNGYVYDDEMNDE